MPDITWDIDLGGVKRLTDSAETLLGDLTPLWEGSVDALARRWMSDQFATQGRAGGNPWAPLSPVTLELKSRRHREKMGILRDSDNLYRSLTNRSDPQELKVVTPTSYEKGSRINVNGWGLVELHQYGWTMDSVFGQPVAARSILPRRLVPDPFPSAWLQELEKTVVDYLEGGLSS